MKRQILCWNLIATCSFYLYSQSDTYTAHRNFPLIVTLQFHALATPLHDIRSHLQHVGLGLGTEISLNGQNNWAQQFHAIWIPNKEIGGRVQFNTQSIWRPHLAGGVYTEFKVGVGYQYAWRPVHSFQIKKNEWIAVGKKGKGMLALPLGLSFGYNSYRTETYLSPFAGYQTLIIVGYNPSVPVLTESLFHLGCRVHFK